MFGKKKASHELVDGRYSKLKNKMPKFIFVAWWQFMALLLCSAVPLGSFAIVPIKVGGKYGANLLKFEYILVL